MEANEFNKTEMVYLCQRMCIAYSKAWANGSKHKPVFHVSLVQVLFSGSLLFIRFCIRISISGIRMNNECLFNSLFLFDGSEMQAAKPSGSNQLRYHYNIHPTVVMKNKLLFEIAKLLDLCP